MDPEPQFTLIRSSKCKKECYKLVEGGFVYGKQRVIGDITHWQCEKRESCKARLHTKGTQIIKRTNEHLHDSDIRHVRSMKVKRRARESIDHVHHIVGEELESATVETTIKLPKVDSLKRTIRRVRQSNNNVPAQPESLEELIIPLEYRLTAKGDDFLLYDSGPGINLILVSLE